jgi:bifunctional oligoribonuclease and PAP phosphatase NrnA
MMEINKIISALQRADSVAIMPHVSVDGDGLGSSIALGLALRKLNKKVKVYLEEDILDTYSFLPGREMVETFNGDAKEFDFVVALDTGDMARLGRRAEIFNKAKTTANIDHHQTNTMFAEFNYVQSGSAAVGEIVYQMIKLIGLDIEADMADCLYVAISTDTGGFKYSNTTAITHQITADLINNGARVAEISQWVFDSTSIEKLMLTSLAINSIELLEDKKIALLTITNQMLNTSGAAEEDSEGLVNLGRSIRGVEVSVMLREKGKEGIKINLRSNTYVDVSAIAQKLSGGGHKRAAGCTVQGEISQVKNTIINEIKRALNL